MRFDVISLFPELFQAFTEHGIAGRALQRGLATLRLWNPRDYTHDVHRTVDDRPYGGGPGMVMKVVPLQQAIQAVRAEVPTHPVLYLSPQGRVLNQTAVQRLAEGTGLILLAGRYEGVDERLLTRCVDAEWSIGDYILSGGELPAMVLMEALIRLLPGALGHADSAAQDSYGNGLLDYPHYTRPEILDDQATPTVLLSGHHAAIRRWRLKQSLGRTWLRRPDLLQQRELTAEERQLLAEFIGAQSDGTDSAEE